MPADMKPAPIIPALLFASLALAACNETGPNSAARFEVDDQGLDLGLTLPSLSGWEMDPDVELDDPETGGDAMVLFRKNSPVGSPRITVNIAPPGPGPTRLQEFLEANLRAMGKLEREAGMRITRVAQKPLKIGPRRAYIVRHEFTIGRGDTQQALTQLAAVLVVDGRGVTATAVGRTELFHPLAEQIGRMLTGIEIDTPTEVIDITDAVAPAPAEPAAPVDLGTLGGK